MLLRELRQSIDQDSWCNNVQSLDETGVAPMTETGVDLAFYKGGCPIHLKGAPPPPQLFWPMLPEPNNFFGLRRYSWRQAVVRHLELCQITYPVQSSYSSCFVFTKHPVQLKTVTTCFQNMFFSKKRHLNKRAGVWTPWTPPCIRQCIAELFLNNFAPHQLFFDNVVIVTHCLPHKNL